VRALASDLDVSPATVSAAYRALAQRGLVSGNRRRGTVVAAQPPLRVRGRRPLPSNVRDLAHGNPDPGFLPPLEPALARVDPAHVLYGGPAKLDRLVELADEDFAADGIGGDIAVTSGALEGIERVAQAHLRPGDSVVLEDPSWPRIADLVRALGLRIEPAPIDERGFIPDELERRLERGARAVIATLRGQNPTGAAVDAERGAELRDVLSGHPDVLVVEDDFLAGVAGARYVAMHGTTESWVVIRSLGKTLSPDLRVALVAGDPLTINRLEGRQLVGPGWVSHLLQQLAAQLLGGASTRKLLVRAETAYAERRDALIDALATQGIRALGRSGLGVWVPLEEEATTVQQLLARGWAVSAGERFRFESGPGMRITTTGLEPHEADELADAIAESVGSPGGTYSA
jgi:DNA-binding transcriptional MocR family regulator